MTKCRKLSHLESLALHVKLLSVFIQENEINNQPQSKHFSVDKNYHSTFTVSQLFSINMTISSNLTNISGYLMTIHKFCFNMVEH